MKKKMRMKAKRTAALLVAAAMLMTSNVVTYATEAGSQTDAKVQTTDEGQEVQTEDNADAAVENEGSAAQQTTDGGSSNVTGEVSDSADDATAASDVTADVIVDENNDKVEIKKSDRPYLALGADLSEEQRNTVLSLMGIDPANLGNYDVVYTTNAEEHQYLDSYISSSQIGSKSWSSVVIVKRDKGNGLNISTRNINYCTVGMYKNALTTAGITDADIIVAGPQEISGTAALVGVFKAYQEMTGETINADIIDASLNELVVTGQLEQSIAGLSDEEVEEFIAYIKSVIAQNDLKDEASINQAIDDACSKYNVTLSDSERQQIVDLLLKITSLGINLDSLVDYAESLYHSFKDGGGDSSVLSSVGTFFSNVFSSIADFFKGLFS